MNLKEPQKKRDFRDFDQAAEHLLEMISNQTGISTLFIAKHKDQVNRIVTSYGIGVSALQNLLPFHDDFCNLSIQHGEEALLIGDVATDPLTQSMGPENLLGISSFIGVPVYYENGNLYGTVCGIERQPVDFHEEQVQTFAMMASLVTYMLELEKANEQIQSLLAPLVPVTKGVAILPVIGEITAPRAQRIIDHVLESCEKQAMEYLVIDVSGVSQINSVVGEYLLKLVSILKIIGVTPVITGIQPFMAIKVPHFAAALKGVLIEANLEAALRKLGFVFIKECE